MKTSKKWRKPLFRQPERDWGPCGPPVPLNAAAPPQPPRQPAPQRQRSPDGPTAVARARRKGEADTRTAGAERRQWRKKRGESPVSRGVEGSRFRVAAQRPLRTAAAGGHSPPARCRAAPGSGHVFMAGAIGPGHKNAAALAVLPGGLCGGRRRLAAEGPKAPRPAKQKSGARGPWPRAPLFQDASRPAAAPPPTGFPLTPKRQRKSPAFRPIQPRSVHHPEKGGSDREP